MSDLELLRAVVRNAFSGDAGRMLDAAFDIIEEAVVKAELKGDTNMRGSVANYLLKCTADIEFKTRLGKLR